MFLLRLNRCNAWYLSLHALYVILFKFVPVEKLWTKEDPIRSKNIFHLEKDSGKNGELLLITIT